MCRCTGRQNERAFAPIHVSVAVAGMRAPVFSRLLLPLWLLRAAAQAGKDAGRAWAVAPNVYRNSRYRRDQNGGWRVVRRRHFRRKDVLWLKLAAAKQTFVAS